MATSSNLVERQGLTARGPGAAGVRAVPSAVSLCLPPEYRQQGANLTLDEHRDSADAYWSDWRIAESHRWQFHVYAWAARLIRERGLRSVLDVGCGVATKLARHLQPVCADTVGVDQPSALAVARRRGVSAALHEIDLEAPGLELGRSFDLIVCADVIEHLADPDPMLEFVRRHAHETTLFLVSTPERDRERGRECRASNKPEHVREWARSEFVAFLRSRGLRPLRSRLLPKDEREIGPCRETERAFRLRTAATSPLCCQAVLCAIGSPDLHAGDRQSNIWSAIPKEMR